MNKARKYLRSQFGRVQEKIKMAILSGKPVIFLQTEEMDFVKVLVENKSIYKPVAMKLTSDNVRSEPSLLFQIGFESDKTGISTSGLSSPKLYLIFNDETEDMQRSDSATISLNKALSDFIKLYNGLSISGKEIHNGETLDTLKKSAVIVVSSGIPTIPKNIALYSEYVRVDPMEGDELKDYITSVVRDMEADVETFENTEGYLFLKDEIYLDDLAKNLKGLTGTKIRQILARVKLDLGQICVDRNRYPDVLRVVRTEKEQLIATSSILALEKQEDNSKTDNEPAGLDRLSSYLKDKRQIVNNRDLYRRKWYIDAPKGVLVSGIPGSGKSMMARYTASLLGLPLIRMDMGDVQDKYVGSSEHRMTEALTLVESMSPCVLWIDEIEKSFSGSQGGEGDGGVTKRLFGKFLTWMQEKERKNVCCFVFATANDISSLPPELFRSGRFDAKFSIYMPSCKDCGDIFESMIKSQCIEYRNILEKDGIGGKMRLFDEKEINGLLFMKYLNDRDLCLRGFPEGDDRAVNRKNKFFTGADIGNVIKSAKEMYALSFENKRDSGFVYDSLYFKNCLEDAIRNIRTYGETDLVNIACCYAGLAFNNFMPASQNDIMPFAGYDELRQKDGKLLLYEAEKEFNNEYDECLFKMMRNVLNNHGEYIIRKRRGEVK